MDIQLYLHIMISMTVGFFQKPLPLTVKAPPISLNCRKPSRRTTVSRRWHDVVSVLHSKRCRANARNGQIVGTEAERGAVANLNGRTTELNARMQAREAALAAAQQAGPSDGSVSVHSAEASRLPHLVNLHEDPMLSECVVYPFKAGITKIGRPNAETKQDVMLSGLNIKKEHAVVENVDGKVTIRPVEGAQAKIFVNGDLVAAGQSTELSPGDAVILGNNFVFRFCTRMPGG